MQLSGDVLFVETTNGGVVVSPGSMCSVGSLGHNDYSSEVARITEKVLRRFVDDRPLILDE